MMVICHFKYRKTNPKLAAESTFKMPLFPVMNYIILLFFVFVLIVLAFNKETRIALIVTPIWFILLEGIFRFRKIRNSTLKEEEKIQQKLEETSVE